MLSGLTHSNAQDETMPFNASETSSCFALTALSQSCSSIATSPVQDALSSVLPAAVTTATVEAAYTGPVRPVPAVFFSRGMFVAAPCPTIKSSPSQTVCIPCCTGGSVHGLILFRTEFLCITELGGPFCPILKLVIFNNQILPFFWC